MPQSYRSSGFKMKLKCSSKLHYICKNVSFSAFKCHCRYFDRYRDKKDIAEEVLSMRLDKKNPFTRHQRQEQFPLIHRYKRHHPSWLKTREEKMRLRLEQYKDLP